MDTKTDKEMRWECLSMAHSLCGWGDKDTDCVLTTPARFWRFIETGATLHTVAKAANEAA